MKMSSRPPEQRRPQMTDGTRNLVRVTRVLCRRVNPAIMTADREDLAAESFPIIAAFSYVDNRNLCPTRKTSPSTTQDRQAFVSSLDLSKDGGKACHENSRRRRGGHSRPRPAVGRPGVLQRPFADRSARAHGGR